METSPIGPCVAAAPAQKIKYHADAGGAGRGNGHVYASLAHAYASDCGVGLNRRPANVDADDGYHEHGDGHVREVRAHVRGHAIR